MTEKTEQGDYKEPAKHLKLVKWYDAGFPPIDLNANVSGVVALVRQYKHLEELLKAADEVIRLNQIQGEGVNYVKALKAYNKLKSTQKH